MDTLKCTRCDRAESIPTHQFVKFDGKVHYVCKSCWEDFRRWFIKQVGFGSSEGESKD
ncbi:MAG: hypothetical protein HYZ53_21000 [Planctomycetes bacterium]|nr:hypothetical protein [Planctomycetota bacterium]